MAAGEVGPQDFVGALIAGGTIHRDIAALNWEATPLGAPASWPQSLQTTVRTMLGSRFAMWMAWGPELTFLCNEAYRRDTLGSKYPWALGKPASEVWAEIWPEIGPRIDSVMRTGAATWDEALLLYLQRSGFTEETYHTFSYSPLTDDSGRIAGMLCVVSEETERVIAVRRMGTIRDLGAATAAALTPDDVLRAAQDTLSRNPSDIPWAALYRRAPGGGRKARLFGTVRLPVNSEAAPAQLADGGLWPLDGVTPHYLDLPEGLPETPRGSQPLPPHRAVVMPLLPAPGAPAEGWLIVGLNPCRPLNLAQTGFLDLVARQISAGLGAGTAFELERRRAEELTELDRAKTAFFTNVSHELRTPLTLMLGPTADALADRSDPLPEAHRRRLEIAHHNAERLLGLVNSLLDLSRLESGRVPVRLQRTDLSRYTSELASMFDSVITEAGLDFKVVVPAGLDAVPIDREMWAKIVLNLLSNAVKHTFTGGVTVELAVLDGPPRSIELKVADTGIGIEPEQQEQLFERFHRVEGAPSRSHEGSGIGLALVAELSNLLGGSVSVQSAVGAGSTFTVVLPVPDTPVSDGTVADDEPTIDARGFVATASRWVEAGTATGVGGASAPADAPRILVVDDNADMRRYVVSLLSEHFRVDAAVDGADALEQIRNEVPDLVLTDVMMPRLDGFGLVAALRSEVATSNIPVVMLSARAGEDGVAEGLEAGADDYLAKPFTARELLARIRANLELNRARHLRAEFETLTARQVASREHQIAEELQASLLPALAFDPDHLEVATFYRPGVEGTQVGGDWYDVIELGAGRTALVIGDVMGRGVRAAAVMGQLRSAIRAYARLDLAPADVLELCDGAVRDLGEDQIVTCVYAVFDPVENSLSYANAGHLPPLLAIGDGPAERLTAGASPPLGSGPLVVTGQSVELPVGATLALYTDGLVERRDRDIDSGVDLLARELASSTLDLADGPAELVARMLPDGPDDDIAVLLARVPDGRLVETAVLDLEDNLREVSRARQFVESTLESWGVGGTLASDTVLLSGELVGNALTHGQGTVQVRIRRSRGALMLEVSDQAPFLPRRLRSGLEDEHGRGLLLVTRLSSRWGVRPTPTGKAVWFVMALGPAGRF